MKSRVRKSVLMPLILALGSLCGSTSADAASLTNGNFSSGLTGWTALPSVSVSVVNGQAVLSESTTASEVDLYQDFTIPTGATSLTFSLITLTSEPPSSVNFPDGFGASLLNPISLASLVPTVNSNTDSFYTRDLVNGVTQGRTASGVTLSPSPTSLPLGITVNIPSLGWPEFPDLVPPDRRWRFLQCLGHRR